MAWTAPRTWVANAILQAAQLNTDIRDNLLYLKGLLDGTGADDVTLPRRLFLSDGALTGGVKLGSRARLFSRAVADFGGPHLTVNAYHDGTNWVREDTTQAAYLLSLTGGAAGYAWWYAAAGANPIAWTTLLALDTAGKLTGSAVWNSGRFAVAAGATVDTNHAWLTPGLRPAFVLGYYQAGTQILDGNVQTPLGIGPASTEKIRITVVDTLKVRVVSGDTVSNTVVLYAILGPVVT
jgi:hypothetical protein